MFTCVCVCVCVGLGELVIGVIVIWFAWVTREGLDGQQLLGKLERIKKMVVITCLAYEEVISV